MPPTVATLRGRRFRPLRSSTRLLKRVVPLALAVYFIPWVLLGYVACGLLDVRRNCRRTLGTLDRYFAGNGLLTWVLSPVNLLIDLLCLPHRNRGVYDLADLPHHRGVDLQQAAVHRQALRPAPADAPGAVQRERHHRPERLHPCRQPHPPVGGEEALHLRRHPPAQVGERVG